MTIKVLALLEAQGSADELVSNAAQLARSMNADLLLGFDPSDEPFERLAPRLTRCIDAATRTGAQTSTMLIRLDDPAAILRIVRLHNVAVVILHNAFETKPADVIAHLRGAGVAVRLIPAVRHPEPAIA